MLRKNYGYPAEEIQTPVDINTMIEKSVKLQSLKLQEEGIPIENDLHPALPRVMMDENRMRFLINELIRNAMEPAGPEGHPEREEKMRVRTFLVAGGAVMEIECTGCGAAFRKAGAYSTSPINRAFVRGKHFFQDVAPCMNNHRVALKFEQPGALDETLDYVITYRMEPTPVSLRLLKKEGSAGGYLLMRKK